MNGGHLAVHKELAPLQISRKAAHTVIHRNDIRVELTDEIVERLQRRDLPAGRHIDIHAKGSNTGVGMELWIGVHRHMTLVEMCKDGLRHRLLCIHGLLAAGDNGCLLCNQHRDACPLRIVVLLGNVENPCADHICDLR